MCHRLWLMRAILAALSQEPSAKLISAARRPYACVSKERVRKDCAARLADNWHDGGCRLYWYVEIQSSEITIPSRPIGGDADQQADEPGHLHEQ